MKLKSHIVKRNQSCDIFPKPHQDCHCGHNIPNNCGCENNKANCDNKDKDSVRLFEMLGAKFNKSIHIPEDYHLYSKQRKTRKQYKLELN